jgi:hypothetical protein
MCSSSGKPFVHAVFYGMFFIQLCKQSSRWKTAYIRERKTYHNKTGCTNGFPDDGHMMTETCIRHQELNQIFEKCAFVGLRRITVSQCTVQKH